MVFMNLVVNLRIFPAKRYISFSNRRTKGYTRFVETGISHLSASQPIYLPMKQFPTDLFAFSTTANRIGKCMVMLSDVINFCKQRSLIRVHGLLFSTGRELGYAC